MNLKVFEKIYTSLRVPKIDTNGGLVDSNGLLSQL